MKIIGLDVIAISFSIATILATYTVVSPALRLPILKYYFLALHIVALILLFIASLNIMFMLIAFIAYLAYVALYIRKHILFKP